MSGKVINFQFFANSSRGPGHFTANNNDNQRTVHNLIIAIPERHNSIHHITRNLTAKIEMKHTTTFVLSTQIDSLVEAADPVQFLVG